MFPTNKQLLTVKSCTQIGELYKAQQIDFNLLGRMKFFQWIFKGDAFNVSELSVQLRVVSGKKCGIKKKNHTSSRAKI